LGASGSGSYGSCRMSRTGFTFTVFSRSSSSGLPCSSASGLSYRLCSTSSDEFHLNNKLEIFHRLSPRAGCPPIRLSGKQRENQHRQGYNGELDPIISQDQKLQTREEKLRESHERKSNKSAAKSTNGKGREEKDQEIDRHRAEKHVTGPNSSPAIFNTGMEEPAKHENSSHANRPLHSLKIYRTPHPGDGKRSL